MSVSEQTSFQDIMKIGILKTWAFSFKFRHTFFPKCQLLTQILKLSYLRELWILNVTTTIKSLSSAQLPTYKKH